MDRVGSPHCPCRADGEPMHTAERALRAGEVDRTAAQNHRITTRTLLSERSTPMRRARLAWSGLDGASRRRTAGRGRRAAGLAAREPPRGPYWTCRWSCGRGVGPLRPQWPRPRRRVGCTSWLHARWLQPTWLRSAQDSQGATSSCKILDPDRAGPPPCRLRSYALAPSARAISSRSAPSAATSYRVAARHALGASAGTLAAGASSLLLARLLPALSSSLNGP